MSSYRCRGCGRGASTVHTVESDFEHFFIDSLKHDISDSCWYEEVMVNEDKIEMKLDTGADTNCMPLSQFKQLTGYTSIPVYKSTARLSGYGKHSIEHIGKVHLKCVTRKGAQASYDFFLTTEDGPTILGC